MKLKKYGYLLYLLLFLSSCVSEFNADLPSQDDDILVVDGYIVAGRKAVFNLSKSFLLNDASIPQKALDVQAELIIVGSDGYQSRPATPLGKGAYQIEVGELDDNVAYGIQIKYDGNTYCSELAKPMKTPEIDSISWMQPENKETVAIRVSTHGSDSNSKYYAWSYAEDWEIYAQYYTVVFYDPLKEEYYEDLSAPYYYCWKSNNRNKILIGTTESLVENRLINKQLYEHSSQNSRFSMLYSVLVTQRAITKSAYDYYQNTMIFNEEMGGLFTPQPSEVGGNIICQTDPAKKVIGYVEILKNVSEKRIYIYRGDIQGTATILCNLNSLDSVRNYMKEHELYKLSLYYGLGYRPVSYNAPNGNYELIDGWTDAVCTDCRESGGTKNKPDFWPNDHK